MSIGVIILNWNGLEDTLECLMSVTQARFRDCEVIVVDNGSTDDSCHVIPNAYPAITFIATGENLGWAGGNNVGIRHAMQRGHELIFLLNNDTTIDPGCLEALSDIYEITGPALVHPAIYYYDEPWVPQLDPSVSMTTTEKPKVFALDHAYGAALCLHAEVVRQVGLIDERFFLQLEETDYYLRAKRAGFRAYCGPGTRILHKESRAFGGRITPVKTYYIVRNSLLLLSKHPAMQGGVVAGLKRLAWTLIGMISRARQLPPAWRLSDLAWLAGDDNTACAIRYAFGDFLARRFGRLSDAKQIELNTPN